MSEGEVRSILTKAGWGQSEIEASLGILKGSEDQDSLIALQGGDPQAFRPDMEFSSQDLSRLLGIDVVIDPSILRDEDGVVVGTSWKQKLVSAVSVLAIVLLALGLALGLGVCFAYFSEIGPFAQ